MKIAHIITSLASGGAQRITVDICNELSKKHQVYLIQIMQDENERLTFYRNQLNSNVNYICLSGTPDKIVDIKIVFRILKVIKRLNLDVVHSHMNIVYSFLPTILMSRISFFHTLHNTAEEECLRVKGISLRRLIRFFYSRKLITPITISKESMKSYNAFYSLNNSSLVENGCYKKTKSVNNSLVTKFFENLRASQNEFIFLTIGRFSEQKNHRMLINVFNRLVTEGKRVKLLIIGSGFDSQEGRELQQKACNNIIFLGLKENVGDYLLNSDCFCLSSLWEGMPISLLEALSCGVYSISTPAGGIPNVITNDDVGLVSKGFSEEEYYLTVQSFLSQKQEYNKRNIEMYFDENFCIHNTVNKLNSLYSV